MPGTTPNSVVFEGYRVGGDVHLGFVLGQLDDSTVGAELVAQLGAARFTGSVEPGFDGGLATGAAELHERRLYPERPSAARWGIDRLGCLQSQAMTDVGTSTSTRGTSRPPVNYAARRMLVTTIVITAVAALGLAVWQVTNGESDTPTVAAGSWGSIALIDRTTGSVTTVDAAGEVVDEFDGVGRVLDVHSFGSRLALVGTTQIAIVDTEQPDAEPLTIAIDRRSTVIALRTTESDHLVVGDPSGGNIVIVDVADGTLIDVGEVAGQSSPLMFTETVRWADDGSAFAVADAANFQTIIVQPGAETAIFLPDQPMAVGNELIATSQIVGLQADVSLVDLDRRNRATVPTEIPVGGVMVDDRLVMVSIDGGVFQVASGDQQAEPLGQIVVPTDDQVRWVHPTFAGERLVVVGEALQVVIDLDGRTIFTTSFSEALTIDVPDRAWSCLPVGGGDTYQSVVSLDSGEQLIDLTGLTVTGASNDGCTVIGERDGVFEVATADGPVRLGRVRSATLGPDGRSVVWTTTSGRTELLTIDGDLELADPIDISDVATSSIAVVFLTD